MGSVASCSRPRIAPADNFQTNGEGKKAWATVDNSLSGSPGFLLKERIQCFCEGGSNCTRESPEAQKTPNAIPGLHSSWVTDDIVAMARPWQDCIIKYGLGKVFQEKSIGLILNLQEVGEHAHCGRGILPSTGFSYDPETFMAHGIAVCCMAWRDMGVPHLEQMKDIVQVMSHTGCTKSPKIAVHCHAGLGRTGLAISCYLVFAKGYEPSNAVNVVRKGRPGALQTRQQVEFVFTFQRYIKYLRCVFMNPELGALGTSPAKNPESVHLLGQSETASASETGARSLTLGKIGVLRPSVQHQHEDCCKGMMDSNGWSLASETKARLVRSTLSDLSEVLIDRNYRRETYASGLQVIKPTPKKPTQSTPSSDNRNCAAAPPSSGSATLLGRSVVEIQHKFSFRTNPKMFAKEDEPRPPRSMEEALARQQHYLHGKERRNLLHIHKVVLEVCSLLVSRAKAFSSHHASNTKSADELPNDCCCFGDVLVRCIRRNEPLTGSFGTESISPNTVDGIVASIKYDINAGNWEELRRSPTVALITILEDFLQSFASPSLSSHDLNVILFEIGPSVQANCEAVTNHELANHIGTLSSDSQCLMIVVVDMLRQVLLQKPPLKDDCAKHLFEWATCNLLGMNATNTVEQTGVRDALHSFLVYLSNADDWSGVFRMPVKWQET